MTGLPFDDPAIPPWFKRSVADWVTGQFATVASQLGGKQRVVAVDPADYRLSGMPDDDEGPKLQKLLNDLPDRTHALIPALGFQTRTQQPLTINGKHGASIGTLGVLNIDDAPRVEGGAQIIYDGPPVDAAIGFYDSDHCQLRGMSVWGGKAKVGVDLDQSRTHDPSHICSQNKLSQMTIATDDATNTDWACIRISEASRDNCEYMQFEDLYLRGPSAGQFIGTGIRNGPSPNAKSHEGTRITFAFLAKAIDCRHGSLHMTKPNFTACGTNWLIAGQSESCTEIRANSENSLQHLLMLMSNEGYPFESLWPRLDVHACPAGKGYITVQVPETSVAFIGGDFEGQPSGTVLDMTTVNIAVTLERMRVPEYYTEQMLGLDRINHMSYVRAIDCRQAGGKVFRGGTQFWGDPYSSVAFEHGGRVHLAAPTPEHRLPIKPGMVSFEMDTQAGALLVIACMPDGTLRTTSWPLTVLPDHLQP